MNKKLEIYYPEDLMVNVFAQPGKYLKNDYARYFINEMLGLAVDKDFSGNDLRVFLAILANLGYENNIYQFNPHIAFRNRAKNYKELCRAWDKQTLPNTQKSPVDLDLDGVEPRYV